MIDCKSAIRNVFRISAFAAIVTVFLSLTSNADTFLPPVNVNGKNVTLGVEGKGKRVRPLERIVVCSDGQQDDVSMLRKVARIFFPDERYEITNGLELKPDDDASEATVAYFGSDNVADNPCLSISPGLKEYVALRGRILRADNEAQNEGLKKQFKTEKDVLTLGSFCQYGRPSTQIDGRTHQWSIQLRSNMSCPLSYLSVFGISKVCLTPECPHNESEQVIQMIEE